jgi:hypothetical protein
MPRAIPPCTSAVRDATGTSGSSDIRQLYTRCTPAPRPGDVHRPARVYGRPEQRPAAVEVFREYGAEVNKRVYIDRHGSTADLRRINAAWDVLKHVIRDRPDPEPSRPMDDGEPSQGLGQGRQRWAAEPARHGVGEQIQGLGADTQPAVLAATKVLALIGCERGGSAYQDRPPGLGRVVRLDRASACWRTTATRPATAIFFGCHSRVDVRGRRSKSGVEFRVTESLLFDDRSGEHVPVSTRRS